MHPMPKLIVVMLLMLATKAAVASQTVCTFSADSAPHYYELELVGYGDARPLIVFSSTTFAAGKRTPLPPASYSLDRLNRSDREIDLEFHNPDDSALPPSFTLKGSGERVWLTIGSTRIRGDLSCDY